MKNKKILSLLIMFALLIVFSNSVIANDQKLIVDFEHIILDKHPEMNNIVKINDQIGIKNISSEEIVSNVENPEIKVRIPENHVHLEVKDLQGVDIPHLVLGGEVILNYLLPAERSMEISLTYFIVVDEIVEFPIEREYAITSLNIYLPANAGLVFNSSELTDAGAVSIEQRTYNYFTISDVVAGNVIETTIAKGQVNEPGITDNRVNQGYDGFHNPGHIRFWEASPVSGINPHLFTLVFVGLIAFTIGNYFYRLHMEDKKSKEQQTNQDDDIFIRLYKEESVLKKKLAELQIRLDDGELDEEEFSKRREIYKKKLIAVKLKIKEFTE